MYKFYLKDILFPVTPGKMDTSIGSNNKVITMMDGKPLNIIKTTGLRDIRFDLLLPGKYMPFVQDEYRGVNFKPPEFFLTKFREIKTDIHPVNFFITRELPDNKIGMGTNINVTLESYTVVEDASNGGDYTVSMHLREYIYPDSQRILNEWSG